MLASRATEMESVHVNSEHHEFYEHRLIEKNDVSRIGACSFIEVFGSARLLIILGLNGPVLRGSGGQ